jgi:hypothetical protein
MALGADGDLALEQAHQVALAGGFAPEVGAADSRRDRLRLDRHVAPARLSARW